MSKFVNVNDFNVIIDEIPYFCSMIIENPLFIDTIDSTNKKLKELLVEKADLPDYFCVAADYQSAGRGQGSNRWQSDRGLNVLASILFKPSYTPSYQFILNQCFALSVRALLAQYVEDVKIKWPNDIYVGKNKIAGILIEHNIQGESIKNTIAGVGININQTEFDKDIPNPISLKLLTNRDFDVHSMVRDLIGFCRQYKCSNNLNAQDVHKEYLSHLFLYQEFAWYEMDGKMVEAEISGTDVYGRLLLRDREGNTYCCGMKEVRLCLK